MQRPIARGCKQIKPGDLKESHRWRQLRSFFLFHLLRLLRRYPAWAGHLPAPEPRLQR